MLATLGADVIHIESIQRPDGMRMTGGMFAGAKEAWWEYSFFFLNSNTNKRAITLDLTNQRGIEIAKRLIATSDIVIENFSPRVMEGFGLDWDAIHAINPRCIFTRMPAFGLDGPWRDNVGFAQTMEQMTGLAWCTGHVEDRPRIQRGPCDPISGMHAVFATLVALFERDALGRGVQIECTMVEGALNAAAEQVIEASAYGNVLSRDGNRSPWAAPQGLYPCVWPRRHGVSLSGWRSPSKRTPSGRRSWAGSAGPIGRAGSRAPHCWSAEPRTIGSISSCAVSSVSANAKAV